MIQLVKKDDALLLAVKVVPNSSRTKVAGMLGDALKIKVAAPPEGGKANEAVLEVLAEVLGIARLQVTVAAGHTVARKTIQISGISETQALARLNAALGSQAGELFSQKQRSRDQ